MFTLRLSGPTFLDLDMNDCQALTVQGLLLSASAPCHSITATIEQVGALELVGIISASHPFENMHELP